MNGVRSINPSMVKKILKAIYNITFENFVQFLCATACICVGIRCIIDHADLMPTIFVFAIGAISLFDIIIDLRSYIKSMPEDEDNE